VLVRAVRQAHRREGGVLGVAHSELGGGATPHAGYIV